jgi:hypothetical protein
MAQAVCPTREQREGYKRLLLNLSTSQHQHGLSRLCSTSIALLLSPTSLSPITMFARIATIIAVTLAAVSPAMADHLITFKNNCGNTVTPMLTNTGGPFIKLAALGRGQTTTTTIPEAVSRFESSECFAKELIDNVVVFWPDVWADWPVQPAGWRRMVSRG